MEIHLRGQVLRSVLPDVAGARGTGLFCWKEGEFWREGLEPPELISNHFAFCGKIVIILFANSRNIVIFVLSILRCKKSTFKLKKGGTRGNESEGSDFLA